MDKVACQVCQLEASDDKSLHKHLKVHDLRIAEYYQKYHPKLDLHDKSLIKFKNKDQYLSSDFNTRQNLKSWLESVDKEEAKKYCAEILQKRKDKKKLIYTPSQVELRTTMFPLVHYYNSLFGSYYDLCEKLGFKNKYKFFDNVLLGKDFYNKSYSIYADTREQKPLKFNRNVEIKTLNVGDYSLSDSTITCNCHVERKSLSDFISTLSVKNFERFEREIERAAENNIYLIILVEDSLNNALSFRYLPYISKKIQVTPEFVFHNVRTLIQKHNHIQFLFVKDRKEASRVIERIFFSECEYQKIDLQSAYDLKKL